MVRQEECLGTGQAAPRRLRAQAITLTPEQLKDLVRTVPDFPAKGIQFRDITTLLAHGEGLRATIDHLARLARDAGGAHGFAAVAGMEARGFIFGAALAEKLGTGFLPLRKPGKLPVETISVDYDLEYGSARLELDPTLVRAGEAVLVVDDLIATGGTALAGVDLIRRAGGICDQALFVIDLPDLGGADALRAAGVSVSALLDFPGH